MRFRKGDKVEVMNGKEMPISWHTAKILCGSDHTCTVHYDSLEANRTVGLVSSMLVRPCPPLVQGVESFMVGDIVEVFYKYSWRIATILKIVGGKKETKRNENHMQAAACGNQYSVRLLGCSKKLVIDGSDIRIRQTWVDGKWIRMVKNSGAGEGGDDVIASNPSKSNYCQKMKYNVAKLSGMAKSSSKKDCTNTWDDAAYMESAMVSSRSLKRMSPYGSSIVEAHNERVKKLRAIEKDGRTHRVVPSPVLEKGYYTYSWRHAPFASNGLQMMPGYAPFLLALKRCYNLWLLPDIPSGEAFIFDVYSTQDCS